MLSVGFMETHVCSWKLSKIQPNKEIWNGFSQLGGTASTIKQTKLPLVLLLKHDVWSLCRMTGNLVEEWECVLKGVHGNVKAFGLYSASHKRTLEAF